MSSARLSIVQRAALAAICLASCVALRATVPDDYDSIGFVLGIGDVFDMARFQPHFPGYPVFVGAGRSLASLGLSPMVAATTLSAFGSAVTLFAVAGIAAEQAGMRAMVAYSLLHIVAWLPLCLGGAALSEAAGAACAAVSFAMLFGGKSRPIASGIAIAMMLGVRLSYWPIAFAWFGCWLVRERRECARASVAASVAAAAWAIPFVVAVGPKELVQLGRVHVVGHFAEWGGSIATRPSVIDRVSALLRGLSGSIAPSRVSVAVVIGSVALGWIVARKRQRSTDARAIGAIALILAPYAIWAFFAQNIIDQPRHLLPLVEALLLAFALILESSWPAIAIATAAIGVAALPHALVRHTTLPPAAQAAEWIRGEVAHDRPFSDTMIFGGRSLRFFSAAGLNVPMRERASLAEIGVDLGRVDHFPKRIIVTSEVGDGPRRTYTRRQIGQFCRDSSVDALPLCLQLFDIIW